MKILVIRIYNLASLEGFHEIDFGKEPLQSAGVFAITGPTGAGKSTILDALCLALYAKTPRYNQAKEIGTKLKDVDGSDLSLSDVRSILRDGAAEGYAEVEFVGVDNRRYRTNWRVYRARNSSTGKLQSDTIQLFDLETNINLSDGKQKTLEHISRLIGLNFEQFTRSVLLAQGEFTAFLKAEKEQKAALLEKLTGTEIYSKISIQVFNNYSKHNTILKELQLQGDLIQLLTEEKIEFIQSDIQNLNSEYNQLTINQKGIIDKRAAYQQLNSLKEKLNNAKVDFDTVQNEILLSKERGDIYEELNLLQGVKVRANEYIGLLNKQKQNLENIEIIKQQIEDLKGVLEVNEHHVESAKNALLQAKNILDNEQPNIEKAKEMDTLIVSKYKEYKKLHENIQLLEENFKKDKIEENSVKELLQKSKEDYSIIQKWFESNKSREQIALNIEAIKSKLLDAHRYKDELNELIQSEEKLSKSILEHQSVIADFLKSKENLDEQKNIIEKQKIFFEDELKKNSIDASLSKIGELNIQREVVNQLNENWKKYIDLKKEIDDLLSQSVRAENENLDFSTKSQELSILILGQEENLNATEKVIERMKIESSESVENLRAQLVDKQPCPVCGSEDHPYSGTKHENNLVLNTLIADFKRLKNEIQTGKLQLERWSTIIESNLKANQDRQQIIEQKEAIADANKKSIFSSIYKDQLSQLDEEAITSFWLAQLSSLNGDIKILDEEILKHRNLSKQKDDTLNQLNEIKENIQKVEQQLNNIKVQLKEDDTKRISHLKDIQEHNKHLTDIQSYLNFYFLQENWWQSWSSQPNDFKEKVIQFSIQWQEKKSAEKEMDTHIQSLEIECAVYEKGNSEKEKQIITINENFKKFLDEFENIKKERGLLLNGNDTNTVEKELKGRLDNAQKTLNESNEKLNHSNSEMSGLTSSQKLLSKEFATNQLAINEKEKAIELWLSQKNISYTIENLIQTLNYTEEWWEGETLYFQHLKEKQISSSKVLEVATKNWKDFELSNDWSVPEDEVSKQIEVNEGKLKVLGQEIAQLEYQLNADKKAKEDKKDILIQIDQQRLITEQWARLNEIIGSSDGKKFKQIAQEYTLDILIQYSNIHLRTLTPRYLLERIEDSLALQVKDLDMGEEIRSIFSLSGGESFLVSLALALGLASLSSQQIRVESLFIDEGFGSLDAKTLGIAMDALENLYQQGRRVGVISHVQEMTERIPVQIQVKRMNSGTSTIEIVG
ncbi:MAG: AAA family ATPase [Chitinophagales bacterium]|nr:AAA family ATPase [Chitinophagales bacterium]